MSIGARRYVLWLFATLAPLASCSSTKTSVTQVWQAPVRPAVPMRSMLVFVARMDEPNRRALEDGLVMELRRRDVNARPSYELFPGELPARAEAQALVKNQGYDGILYSTLLDVKERQTFVPGTTGGFWTSYYGYGWGYGSPGYVMTDEVVTFETTLWDARMEDKLVWTLLTKTLNPSSGKSFVKSLSGAVAPALEKGRLVPPERNND